MSRDRFPRRNGRLYCRRRRTSGSRAQLVDGRRDVICSLREGGHAGFRIRSRGWRWRVSAQCQGLLVVRFVFCLSVLLSYLTFALVSTCPVPESIALCIP